MNLDDIKDASEIDPQSEVKRDPTNDTHPKIERVMIEIYRRMTPSQRVTRLGEWHEVGTLLAESNVRQMHPNADANEIKMRVASRRLSPELMKKAFGWDIAKEGY